MAWNDSLLAASFRGVPFFYEDTKRSGGRRLVEHEFPRRETPYIEDLGRRKREHRISGYVIGDDYVERRAALETALDMPEAGTLIHPYRGQLLVNIRSWTSQEVRDEGRMARFDIDCVENGSQPSPLAMLSTADTTFSAGDDVSTQLQVSFIEDWDVSTGDALAAGAVLLDSLTAALDTLSTWPDLDTTEIMVLVADLSDSVADGVAIAAAVSGFFSGFADAVLAVQEPFDETQSSRGPEPEVDPSCGLGAIANWGATLPVRTDVQVQANQDTLVALVGGCAAVALAQIYARTTFNAQDDADAARDQLGQMIDGLATTAADTGDDASFTAWQKLYQSAIDDLTTRAKQAPSTIVFDLGSALPALVLAQRVYQDPSRASELVARNDAPHPLFLHAGIQALTS